MKKLILFLVVCLICSCVPTHTVRVHRNCRVTYQGNGVGMTPDCHKYRTHKGDVKVYKIKSNKNYKK